MYKKADILIQIKIEDILMVYDKDAWDNNYESSKEKEDKDQITEIISEALKDVSKKLDFTIESIEITSVDYQ